MKKGISIALRVILWSLLGILALVVIIILLVQVPVVQDFGRRKVVTYLQEKLGTDVAIGHLRLGLPNTLLLENVYFEDQQGDTLFATEELFVHISPFRLFRNEVRIDQVRVEKFSSNLRLAADSSFNFDFIIDAFVTGSEEPAPPDSSAALAISLGDFDLNDIRLTWRDETNASAASVSWDHFHASIEESDIDRLRFDVGKTSLAGLYLTYTDPSAGMETENRVGRLDLSSLMFDLTSQEIEMGEVRIDSTRAAFAFLAQSPETQADPDSPADPPAPATPDTDPGDPTLAAPPAEPGWNVGVEQLLISHTGFRFDDHNAPPQPSGMDYMHLDVSDLNLDLRTLSYSPEAITGDLKRASLREKSGLEVKTFHTAFEYNATGASLNGLLLETGGSVLREHIRINYPSIEQATEDLSLLAIEASLPECRVSYADLLLVAPFLAEYEPFRSTHEGIIGIDGRAHGTVGDLVIEHFEATTLDQTRVVAVAHLKGLPEIENAWFDVELQELSSGNRDLVRLAGRDMIPSSVRLPASFSLEGAFTGSMKQFTGQALLRSSYGTVAAEGSMAPGEGEGREKYSARISTSGFHIGRLLKQEDTLGRVRFRASVEGNGTTTETANARIEGELEELEYNGYSYRGLALAGTIRDEQVTAQAAMQDPNIRFALDGSANLSGTYPAVDMRLQLDTLNLRALNLYEKELTLGMELTADLPTADPDHLNGKVAVNNLALQLDSGLYRIDTILLQAAATDTLKTIDLRSEFMRATAAGNFTTSGLAPAIMAHVNRYFATGDSVTENGANTANADRALNPADTNRSTADSAVQQLTFTARIFHPPVLQELLPELIRLDTICIDAHFDNRAQVMQVSAVAPAIRYGSNEIDSVVMAINTGDTSIDYHVLLQRFYNPAVQVINTSLEGEAAGNRLGIHLITRNEEQKERYRIGGILSADSGAYEFRFLPEELVLDYQAWTVQEDNLFYYSDSGFYARNIHLSNGAQSLELNSAEYRPSAPMEVSFNDFELSTLTRIAQQDSLAVGGQLNGNAVVSNLDSGMVFVSDLLVNNFSFRRDTVGNIAIKVNNEQENTYTADISVESDKNRLNLAGSYYPEPVEGNNFDLALDILHLDMGTVEAFSFGQLADASGSVKGSFSITGSTEKPNVLGGLVFQKAAFTPTMINSPLFLEDETIALTADGIAFNNFTVLDSMRNAAVLDGTIYTTDFTDYRFDLRLTTDNFRAINTRAGDNELYYGQLYLDSDVRIEGTIDNPDVNAYLRVNEKTNLTMTLPTSEPGVQEREGVVEFVDMDAPVDTLQTDTLLAATDITGLDLSADLEVDEEAQFTVIVDPVNGDNLQVKGNAALSIGVDPNGTINLTGRYEIAEGAYELSFNLIKRRFEISQGSYITWVGDPYSADVDITAVYLAETAPLELVQDQLTSMSQSEKNTFKQTLPFQVYLHMEGELMKPTISFNIDLPEKERDAHGGLVYARLQQLRLQESDLNKQVFALLVLNRFVAENPLESVGGSSVSSIARQSVSKLLSAQLNRLAGDLIAGVDLNFDLESTEDYSTGQKVDRTDLNVGLSKSLLNDRIRVNVGSSFGLEGQETRGKASTIAGDVSVDYQLSKDGRYLLRAYRQNEYEGVIEGQIIETGLSFIISLDYDEFRELFRK